VGLGPGPVQREGEPGYPSLLEAGDHLPGEEGGGRRREPHLQGKLPGPLDEEEEVPPGQRVPAGEEEEGLGPVGGHLLYEAEALLGGELPGKGVGHGRGPAVAAGQEAGVGHLPGHQVGVLGEIGAFHKAILQVKGGEGP